ncbi:cytochrome B5-like heme steroid binding domain-containing protein [Colletotrichum tofieldiae]|nr:cytochrome B5-like heme steroid binding domain-containing protein [Colletotrichum tofieldiae]
MAEDTASVRQRKPVQEVEDEDNLFAGTPAENSRGKKSKKSRRGKGETDAYSPYVDILRVLSFLFLASCALSYLQSNVRRLQPEKPIYLAINHTIFDVSANPRIYGPGGSYNVFAGRDASRGFVTGCFMEDRTPDMRGVEEMFLPLDDPEIDRHWSYADMQKLQEEELAAAKAKVHDALKHWVDFFSKSDKYNMVGKVKREPGWLEKENKKKLCDQAQKGRVKRKAPGQEDQN